MNRLLIAAWFCAALYGCASIPGDRGSGVSESLIAERSALLKPVSLAEKTGDQRTRELLAKTLSVDDVVQIALLNNPRMRKLYAELGLAQAELYDAARLDNPTIGFAQLSADGVVTKTTFSISQRITELLFLHFNSKMMRSEVLQAQQRVAHDVLSLEADVRAAYYQYVTARMIARLRDQIVDATSASSQYAESLYTAGNISQLQLRREQIAASESLVEQHKSAVELENKYIALLNLVGLSRSGTSIQFDERLPQPGDPQFDRSSLQSWALSQRLDIAATREALRAAQQQLEHTKHWRWFSGADVGVEREHDRGDAAATGPTASLEIPIFNQGGGAVMRRHAKLEALSADLASAELSVRNDVVSQLVALTHARQIVDQYQHSLVPLQNQVVALSQQRFNYMLIGAPDVLLAKQQALSTHQQYLQSVGDYWQAYVELQRISGGKLPGDDAVAHSYIQLDDAEIDTSPASPVHNGEHHE